MSGRVASSSPQRSRLSRPRPSSGRSSSHAWVSGVTEAGAATWPPASACSRRRPCWGAGRARGPRSEPRTPYRARPTGMSTTLTTSTSRPSRRPASWALSRVCLIASIGLLVFRWPQGPRPVAASLGLRRHLRPCLSGLSQPPGLLCQHAGRHAGCGHPGGGTRRVRLSADDPGLAAGPRQSCRGPHRPRRLLGRLCGLHRGPLADRVDRIDP